jgi:hypothetical protein
MSLKKSILLCITGIFFNLFVPIFWLITTNLRLNITSTIDTTVSVISIIGYILMIPLFIKLYQNQK